MSTAYRTTKHEYKGHTVTVEWFYDETADAPWEHCDGHGPVSKWERRDKRPGELVLSEDRGSKRFYDFRAAVKEAKRDGWDAKPYNAGNETRGQQAARAAMADFRYLKAWCDDDWHYSGFVCTIAGFPEYEESVWGIESTAMDEFERDEILPSAFAFIDSQTAERDELAQAAEEMACVE